MTASKVMDRSLRVDLMTLKEVVKLANEEGIKGEKGTKLTQDAIKIAAERGKMRSYKLGRRIYYSIEDIRQLYAPPQASDDTPLDEEFSKMIVEAQSLGMNFPQYVKAKEVYESYISKQIDNAIKKREYIPVDEVKAFLEVAIGELKAKIYNIPNSVKTKFKRIDDEVHEFIHAKIDSAFASIYRKGETFDEKI